MIKMYQVVYADPPWKYGNQTASPTRQIENHYPTMELEDIKTLLSDQDISIADDAVLFLWATAPKLQEALEVLDAWGFEYRTCLIWDKKLIGMGHWFRIQHEILLVGRRGSFPTPKTKIRSVYREARKEHSRKPDYIRSQISQWYPDKSKIELFARDWFEGWDVFGNEIPDTMQKLLR